jgi:voltage-gated potassium channel
MAVVRGSTPNHLHLRERLIRLIGFLAVVDVIASTGVYALEKDAPGSDIHSWPDAIFWTTAQLLTVSSSLANPVTAGGKVLDIVIMFIGITVVAALAGTFGSYLYRYSVERAPHPILDAVKELEKDERAREHGEPTA